MIKLKFPKTKEEAGEFLKNLGALQLNQKTAEAYFTERELELKSKKEAEISSLQKRIDELFLGLFIFYRNNREELTQSGKISIVELPNGSIQVFLANPTVDIRDKKKVIEFLKEHGLTDFVRIEEDVNKIAILMEPEKVYEVPIPGIKITRKEKFLVRPASTAIAITESTKKLKKLLP